MCAIHVSFYVLKQLITQPDIQISGSEWEADQILPLLLTYVVWFPSDVSVTINFLQSHFLATNDQGHAQNYDMIKSTGEDSEN